MSSSAVEVAGLTKTYRIATASRGALSLGAFGEAVSRLRGVDRSETLVALDALDLDIGEGEVVGLVGRNGAGKSTFLKILSRIVEPDAGEARIHGRVGSLLEVGTGFHPELTGRENVYLNGAILGMRRSAIARAFDSIVEFADVARFLDTPVKRYSSGMYVRLAFAVAAHLDTEILLVDEVLAVGDAAFQAKCLKKIGDVSTTEGRTVLFVSHNTTAVEQLCTRAVYFSSGRKVMDGPVREVVARYHGDMFGSARSERPGCFDVSEHANPFEAGGPVVVTALRLEDAAGRPTSGVQSGDQVSFVVELSQARSIRTPIVAVMVSDHAGRLVTTLSSRMTGADLRAGESDRVAVRLRVPELPLAPGEYWLGVGVKDDVHDRKVDAVEGLGPVHVAPANFYGTGYTPTGREGAVLLRHEWSVE